MEWSEKKFGDNQVGRLLQIERLFTKKPVAMRDRSDARLRRER